MELDYNNPKIKSKTSKYSKILKYLDEGKITTPEKMVVKCGKFTYTITFEYSISYDYSNGIYDSNSKNINVVIKNSKEVVSDVVVDKKVIKAWISEFFR